MLQYTKIWKPLYRLRRSKSWRTIPGRSPGEGNGNALHYSCLENSHGQRSLPGYRPEVAIVGHDWQLIPGRNLMYRSLLMNSVCIKLLSRVQLFATPQTAVGGSSVHGSSRQEYWSGLPVPSRGDIPDPGMEPIVSCIASRVFTIWAFHLKNLKPSVS